MTLSKLKLRMFVRIVRSALIVGGAGGMAAASAQSVGGLSVGAAYTYTRSNILPGCACVSLNGGSAELQFMVTEHLDLYGDLTVVHKSGISQDNYSLTQYTYVGGVRYRPFRPKRKLQTFFEIAVGGANTTGTLSPSNTGLGGAKAFAFEPGGGLDFQVTRRLTIVPADVDYLLTTFANGAQNRQNDLRISVGARIRLGR